MRCCHLGFNLSYFSNVHQSFLSRSRSLKYWTSHVCVHKALYLWIRTAEQALYASVRQTCLIRLSQRKHSCPQRPRSFWSAPRNGTSGHVQHGSPRFTDFPSLWACSESGLTNLIGSRLNLLCLQIHSKPECCWTGPELEVAILVADQKERSLWGREWNEQNIAHQTRKQKKCFKLFDQIFYGLQNLWNTSKHDQTRSDSINQGGQTVKCLVIKQCLIVFGQAIINFFWALFSITFLKLRSHLGYRSCLFKALNFSRYLKSLGWNQNKLHEWQ